MDERVVKSSRSRCANLGQAAGASVNPVYTPRAIANRRALTRDRTLFGVDSAPLIRKPALGPACACARVGSRKSLCSTRFRNLASRIKMRHTHQRPLGTRSSAAVYPASRSARASPTCVIADPIASQPLQEQAFTVSPRAFRTWVMPPRPPRTLAPSRFSWNVRVSKCIQHIWCCPSLALPSTPHVWVCRGTPQKSQKCLIIALSLWGYTEVSRGRS